MYVYIHDTYTCIYIYTSENMVYRIYDYYRALTEGCWSLLNSKVLGGNVELEGYPAGPKS